MVKVDLNTLLRRRKISLVEWLSYNDLNSLEDFEKRGETLAGEQGCYVSAELKNKVMELLKPNIPEVSLVSNEEESTKLTKRPQNKKNKKISSKDSVDDVDLNSLVLDKNENEPKEFNENESSEQNI